MPDEEAPPIAVDTRRAAIIHELRNRLRPMCAEWPEALFVAMIENLAEVTLKYEGLASTSTYDRRTMDRLVADFKEAVARNKEAREKDGE
jgi:hypothetical protein